MDRYEYMIAELDYLNSFDIMPYILSNKRQTVSDVMDLIKETHDRDFTLKNPDCMGLFYNLTQHDFIGYIYSRYDIGTVEEVVNYFNL